MSDNAPIEELCQIITHLSQTPRPPRSGEELQAAKFIQHKLETLELEDIQEQPFYAVGKLSERLGTAGLLAGAGMLLGAGKSTWRRAGGTMLVLGAALSARQILKGQAPPWETIYPQKRSQNVIGKIPSAGETENRIVLMAHTDTDITRLSENATIRDYAPYLFAGLPYSALLGSMLMLFNAPIWMRQTMAYLMFGNAGANVVNEVGKSTTGANDNASGIAMLLTLAEKLKDKPLDNTEVVFAFTGCGTAAGQGAAELADQFGDKWKDAWWLSLDGIGSGQLAWVSSHGLSNTIRYKPHPEFTDLFSRIANKNKHLGVMGRSMSTLDDIGPLRLKGLKAAGLMGYDRATGHVKNKADDTPANVEPDSLATTWEFLLKILADIDKKDK